MCPCACIYIWSLVPCSEDWIYSFSTTPHTDQCTRSAQLCIKPQEMLLQTHFRSSVTPPECKQRPGVCAQIPKSLKQLFYKAIVLLLQLESEEPHHAVVLLEQGPVTVKHATKGTFPRGGVSYTGTGASVMLAENQAGSLRFATTTRPVVSLSKILPTTRHLALNFTIAVCTTLACNHRFRVLSSGSMHIFWCLDNMDTTRLLATTHGVFYWPSQRLRTARARAAIGSLWVRDLL